MGVHHGGIFSCSLCIESVTLKFCNYPFCLYELQFKYCIYLSLLELTINMYLKYWLLVLIFTLTILSRSKLIKVHHISKGLYCNIVFKFLNRRTVEPRWHQPSLFDEDHLFQLNIVVLDNQLNYQNSVFQILFANQFKGYNNYVSDPLSSKISKLHMR